MQYAAGSQPVKQMKAVYSFLLKPASHRLYNRVALIIGILNALFFIYFAFFSLHYSGAVLHKIYAIVILFSPGFKWLYGKIAPAKNYSFAINYLLIAAGWMFLFSNWWMSLLHVLLACTDVQARKSIHLHMDVSGVQQQQGIFKKTYPWPDFSNLILKDGLLTLDFKNNRIKQIEIQERVDENLFNEFCRIKIAG